ncbi:MAG: rhomboid family intramembrane serine protease [Anaerolineae bacterium]
MMNEQPPERRRVHPLEEQPPTPPPGHPNDPNAPRRTPVKLRIPAVRPLVTYAFLAINVIVFIVRAISPSLDNSIYLWGANNQTAIFQNGELYRLVTSMFLHAGIYDRFGSFAFENALHLVFNAYIIYVTGRMIEPLFGHVRFALIYLLGGITGAIASAILSPAYVSSVGASGAAFAILGAEFVYLYKHRKLLGLRAQAQMQSLLMLGLINLAYGFVSSLGAGTLAIDNWAHIGGAVGGLVLSWFIAPFFLVRRHPEEPEALLAEDVNPLKARTGTVALYISALLIVLIIGTRLVG